MDTSYPGDIAKEQQLMLVSKSKSPKLQQGRSELQKFESYSGQANKLQNHLLNLNTLCCKNYYHSSKKEDPMFVAASCTGNRAGFSC